MIEPTLGAKARTECQTDWKPNYLSISVGLATYTIAWLSLLNHAVMVPPTDNIEQLIWVRSLEWGYYKHPPLPTWLLWPIVQVLGWNAWATYLMGAVSTLTAFMLMWQTLRSIRGEAFAAIAVLAGLCITFYNGRLYFYNHEIVLIPLVAGCAMACWNAYHSRKLVWWIVLGLCLGLGALAKYQIAVAGLAVLVFWCSRRAWREPIHLFGLLTAGIIALLVFTPHLIWLMDHDFEPLHYAMSSSLAADLPWSNRIYEIAKWWADQLLNRALPSWIFIAALGLLARRLRDAREGLNTREPPSCPDAATRALLLSFGFTPLVFVSAMTLFSGSHIQLHWGTPFLLFIVPAAMELVRADGLRSIRPRCAIAVFTIIQLLLMARVELTAPNGAGVLRRDSDWRYFDAQMLADMLYPSAITALGGPIRIISGPWEESGALALRLSENPLVLIEGELRFSPWVSAEMVKNCGVLELRQANRRPEGFNLVDPAFPRLYWRTLGRASPACPIPAYPSTRKEVRLNTYP